MSTLIEDVLIDTLHLSFEQTVPCSLVHKRYLENVLLTEVRGCGDGHFLCAGRIPAAHQFFNDAGRTPQTDILFYTELGRQASLAISHRFLGISKEEIFIFEQSQAWMKEAAFRRPSPRSAADSVVTEITVRETQKRKNNAVSRVVADQVMSIGGEQVFVGVGAWTVQPAALFHRLRRMARTSGSPAPTESALPRRSVLRDNAVILEPRVNDDRTEFVTTLVVDETHPYFFDHPCDHVPGMLLLEGCTQLALNAFSRASSLPQQHLSVSTYDVNFRQFVECDLPVTFTAQIDRSDKLDSGLPTAHTVRISISQQNALAGTATLSVAVSNQLSKE